MFLGRNFFAINFYRRDLARRIFPESIQRGFLTALGLLTALNFGGKEIPPGKSYRAT